MLTHLRFVLCIAMVLTTFDVSIGQDEATFQAFKKWLEENERKSKDASQSLGRSTATPVDSPIVSDNRSVVIGQSLVAPEPPKPILEISVCDLADLFAIAPSDTARGWRGWDDSPLLSSSELISASNPAAGMGGMGGMGGGMGGMFNVGSDIWSIQGKAEGYRPTPESLITTIHDTVDANWDVNGGKESIHWIGSSLIVHAYPNTHKTLKALLDILETRWNARSTLEMEVQWLWLTHSEERSLSKLMKSSDAVPTRSIDEEALAEFVDALPERENRPKLFKARLVGHNGQTVPWVSGKQVRSITSWEHVKGKLLPNTKVLHFGIVSEFTPMLAHASDHATIVAKSRWGATAAAPRVCETSAEEPCRKEDSPTRAPRPDDDSVVGQSISTTVRIPLGRAAILSSGTTPIPEYEDWLLTTVLSVQLVSPRASKP